MGHCPRLQAGSSSSHLLCFTDLLATFAELLGAAPPTGLDSESFLPVLCTPAANHEPRKPIVMRAGGGSMMIRDGDWKLINRLGSGGFSKPRRVAPGPGDPKGQLYNLAKDPAETQNLWKERPDLVKSLTGKLEKIAK